MTLVNSVSIHIYKNVVETLYLQTFYWYSLLAKFIFSLNSNDLVKMVLGII